MSKCGEKYAFDNDDIAECAMAEEEQAYYKAVNDIAGFILQGSVSYDKFSQDLTKELHGE